MNAIMKTKISYWYGEQEKKARAWDIAYVKKSLPQASFTELPKMDHGEFAMRYPVQFAEKLSDFID